MDNTKKASAGIFDRNDQHTRPDSRASSRVFSEASSHVPERVSSRGSTPSSVSSSSTIRNSGMFQVIHNSIDIKTSTISETFLLKLAV